MAFAKKGEPKSKAVIARETESQIKAVRARLAEMREYKRLLAVDGIKPDQQDKERESALIVQLLRLERVGTPLPSYPKPQAPKAKAESRRGRGRGHGAKPQSSSSNCRPEQACYVGPRSPRPKAAGPKSPAKSFDKSRKPEARRDDKPRRDGKPAYKAKPSHGGGKASYGGGKPSYGGGRPTQSRKPARGDSRGRRDAR